MSFDNDDADMTVKLFYFNLRARGEVLRFLLIHSQMEWEDVLVPMSDWIGGKVDKDSLPPGRTGKKQLPVLSMTTSSSSSSSLTAADDISDPSFDNQRTTTTTATETTTLISESLHIAKWIAGHCDPPLLASTPDLAAKAERIFLYSDVGGDSRRLGLLNPLLNYLPVEESAAQIPNFLDHLPEHLSYLSEEIGEGPYVCGSELTYVDFMVFHYIDNACTLFGEDNVLDRISSNSNLRNFYDKMYRLPAISRRMMNRPFSGSGEVGTEGSIIYSFKAPSRLSFIQTALNEKLGIRNGG
jgi:glutathione S-transferase